MAAATMEVELLEAHHSRVHTGGMPATEQASPCPMGRQLVQDTIDAFMLSRRVANCSAATLRIYEVTMKAHVHPEPQ
jgi:hypothetical protein